MNTIKSELTSGDLRKMHIKHNKRKRVRLELPTNMKFIFSSITEGIDAIDPQNELQLQGIKEELKYCSQKFLRLFFKDVYNLKDHQVESYEMACKDRKNDLQLLMHRLQTCQPGEVLMYVYQQDKPIENPRNIIYIKKGCEFIGINNEGEVETLLEFSRSPKIYTILFKGMFSIMVKHYLPYKISHPHLARTVLLLVQYLISVANIYTLFRSTEEMIDNREISSLNMLKSESVPLRPEFRDEVIELINDIKRGRLPYIKEIRSAILYSITERNLRYRDSDHYTSIKGSSSYSPEFGRLPSLLASAYEIDPIKELSEEFDEITGYVSNYVSESSAITSHGKTITIDQNKIKRRVIHIFNNATQDRMSLVNRLLSSVTSRLQSDCTKDQQRGVIAAINWTSPSYRIERDNPTVACMDLSNATDELNQEFQRLVLEAILPKPMVDWWFTVIQLPREFVFYNFYPVEYVQHIGQPQGLLSSFDAFALAHHFVMLLVMKRSGMEDIPASQAYRVLGDDSIINSVNGGINGCKIIDNYKLICHEIGWSVDLTKSHITRYEDDQAFAEFAKVTVLDGEIITPPPIRMLCQITHPGDRGAREFAFAVWLTKFGYGDVKIIDHIIDKYAVDDRKEILSIIFKGGIIPYLDHLKDPLYCEESDLWKRISIAYLKNLIKESIIDSILNDREMDSPDFMEAFIGKTTVKLESSELDGLKGEDLLGHLLDMIPENHKLVWALQRNANIEDAVKSITGLDVTKIAIAALDLTEEEIEAIFMIGDIISFNDISLLDASLLRELNKKLSTLERFRLKSVYKRIGRLSNSLLEVVDITLEDLDTELPQSPSCSSVDINGIFA